MTQTAAVHMSFRVLAAELSHDVDVSQTSYQVQWKRGGTFKGETPFTMPDAVTRSVVWGAAFVAGPMVLPVTCQDLSVKKYLELVFVEKTAGPLGRVKIEVFTSLPKKNAQVPIMRNGQTGGAPIAVLSVMLEMTDVTAVPVTLSRVPLQPVPTQSITPGAAPASPPPTASMPRGPPVAMNFSPTTISRLGAELARSERRALAAEAEVVRLRSDAARVRYDYDALKVEMSKLTDHHAAAVSRVKEAARERTAVAEAALAQLKNEQLLHHADAAVVTRLREELAREQKKSAAARQRAVIAEATVVRLKEEQLAVITLKTKKKDVEKPSAVVPSPAKEDDSRRAMSPWGAKTPAAAPAAWTEGGGGAVTGGPTPSAPFGGGGGGAPSPWGALHEMGPSKGLDIGHGTWLAAVPCNNDGRMAVEAPSALRSESKTAVQCGKCHGFVNAVALESHMLSCGRNFSTCSHCLLDMAPCEWDLHLGGRCFPRAESPTSSVVTEMSPLSDEDPCSYPLTFTVVPRGSSPAPPPVWEGVFRPVVVLKKSDNNKETVRAAMRQFPTDVAQVYVAYDVQCGCPTNSRFTNDTTLQFGALERSVEALAKKLCPGQEEDAVPYIWEIFNEKRNREALARLEAVDL